MRGVVGSAQFTHAVVDPRLHRPGTHAEPIGDLVNREALQVVERHHRPVIGGQMKVHTPAGLTPHFEIYPPLMAIHMWDFHALGIQKIAKSAGAFTLRKRQASIESRVQKLDFDSGVPQRVLDLGTYYDAAGFPDLTLRMYLDQQEHPEHIPSYPLVVVDKYQDFSPLETAIIDQLGVESDLLIAGDDDQP